MYTIRCGETELQVRPGTTIADLATQIDMSQAILTRWRGELVAWDTEITADGELELLSLQTKEGNLAYQRGLILLLATAVQEMYPAGRVFIEHSLGRALYGRIDAGHPLTHHDIEDVEEHMREIVRQRRPFVHLANNRRVALNILENEGRIAAARRMEEIRTERVDLYACGSFYDYYFGLLPAHTGVLTTFDLHSYAPGFLLRFPDEFSGTEIPEYVELRRFARVFFEATDWSERIGCRYVSDLNAAIRSGRIGHIIAMAEALYEKNLARIADLVAGSNPGIRLITLAGPSSAGKTTTMERLRVQLEVNGLSTVLISLDNYYRNRSERQIFTSDGEVDYESVDALDLNLLEVQLMSLLAGEPVRLARFDFVKGERYFDAEPTVLKAEQLLVMEGLHALNPKVSRGVPAYQCLHIYISALTQLTVSARNRISTTDTRLLRRLVRDQRDRAHDAADTLAMWSSVRKGEESYIFPFQEQADIIFNTALIYEIPVLKTLAQPLLAAIEPGHPAYSQAQRLLRFLDLFEALDPEMVPGNSLLREFIGKK